MPELPDVLAYIHALAQRIEGYRLEKARIVSPFLLRTFDPPVEDVETHCAREVNHIGKRIVICFDNEMFLVFHLMIAGRFRWAQAGAKVPGKIGLASFEFESGTLLMTEASQKKRASLHVVHGDNALKEFERDGLDMLGANVDTFGKVLQSENHTLKRALTDPQLFSGIGNAYSDEILHRARLSPVKLTSRLKYEEVNRLYDATVETLEYWIGVLRERFDTKFPGPGDITAFRPEFAVHGKFGEACPVCKTVVQRIQYADRETNYCPHCQTGGKLLADRSLSRLLKKDWPKTIDDL